MRTIELKPLAWFKTAPQVRTTIEDDDELRQLGESLKERQLQPVQAKPDGTIIFGHRRLAAAKLAGLKELEVIVTDEPLVESQVAIIQLVENLQRAQLSGWDQYQACSRLLQLRLDWTLQDLSRHIHRTPSALTRIVSPSKTIPAVREALKAGRIGIAAVYAISKEPEERQAALLERTLSGASRDEIERERRQQRPGTVPDVKVSRVSIPLPSGVTVVVTGQEVGWQALVDSLVAAGKEAKKGQNENLDVKTWQRVMADRAK